MGKLSEAGVLGSKLLAGLKIPESMGQRERTGEVLFVRASKASGKFRIEQIDAVVYDTDHVPYPAIVAWVDAEALQFADYLQRELEYFRVDPLVAVVQFTVPDRTITVGMYGGDMLHEAYITNETWGDVVAWFEPQGYLERYARREAQRRRSQARGE